MGFLTLDTAVDGLKKAVISVWFRVPSDAVDGARAIAIASSATSEQVLHGVIPLITWGQQIMAHPKGTAEVWTGFVEAGGVPINTQTIITSPDTPLSPSFIGVWVGTQSDPRDPLLQVNIQTQDYATGSGISFQVTGWSGTDTGLIFNDPFNSNNPHNGAPIYSNVMYRITDITDLIFTVQPDSFGNVNYFTDSPNVIEVTVEAWHHLLISWDLDGRKMWCAFDDKNRIGGTGLPAFNDPTLMGPNDQMSVNEFDADPENGESARVTVTSIPTNPINVPGPVTVNYFVHDETGFSGTMTSKEPVQHLEMAELQIFADVILDTGITENRRAFVSAEGKPVPPNQQQSTDTGKDSGSIELLGKRPEVMLHGSSLWIKGSNTGTIGLDAGGNKIPSGQFVPTGTIKKYKPDPSLT